MNIIIVGGGAAGLCLAVEAARKNPKAEIEIIEKNSRLGKKILATGNGKCNISNTKVDEISAALLLFDSIDLMIREEDDGRLYPYSEQASSVVEAFEREIEKLGIKKKLNTEVESIEKSGNGFEIILKNGEIVFADRVAITTGGKASPQFGTTGDGYRFAKNFGHKITKLAPILMPVVCEGKFEQIKGVRAKGIATLLKNGKKVAEEKGEIQFIDQGLSGICIFNLSRLLKIEDGKKIEDGFKEYSISLDLVPEISTEKLINYLTKRKNNIPDMKPSIMLHSFLNNKLADYIYAEIVGEKNYNSSSDIRDNEIEKLSHAIKSLVFKVTGGKGWKEAQATSGGVDLNEIFMDTMESKLVKGLFFGGEVIDYDGPCGGYNLQNAWISGMKAGHNIIKEI